MIVDVLRQFSLRAPLFLSSPKVNEALHRRDSIVASLTQPTSYRLSPLAVFAQFIRAVIVAYVESLIDPLWRFGGSEGVATEAMILEDGGRVRNYTHFNATFWVQHENTIILVNGQKEPTAFLARVSDTRFEGPTLPAAAGWQSGETRFLEKAELKYPLGFTWSASCDAFLERNHIALRYHKDKGGAYDQDEFVAFERQVFVEPGITLPFKAFINMGAYSYVMGATKGNISIGRYSSIGSNVTIMGNSHPQDRLTTHPLTYNADFAKLTRSLYDHELQQEPYHTPNDPVTIGNDVWIGDGALLARGVTIGDGAVIAARSVVTKDVPPYSVIAGTPAKQIRMRFDPDLVEALLLFKWWEFNVTDLPPHWSDPRRVIEEAMEKEASGEIQRWNPKRIDLALELFKASTLD